MSDYGFDFNASAVYNENGKVSVGVNFKDSDGFKFDTTEEGSVKEVTDALYKKFAKEYAAEIARLQKAADKKAKEEKKKSEASVGATPDMVARLRRLEKENAKLRAEIEKKDAANAKIAQERAAKASAKYKDPNYNKPGDDKAKIDLKKDGIDPDCYISVKPSTRRAAQKFIDGDHEKLLRELFSNRDDIFDFWDSMGWPW